jgi:hypothetical protein
LAFSGAALGADDARSLASEAKALVEAKQPGRAFALLEPHEERWAATSSSTTGWGWPRWSRAASTAP